MRFTLPFLAGLAAFTATVFGANITGFNQAGELSFDILSATSALAFRIENALNLHHDAALAAGATMVVVPALFAFHMTRMLFGGSAQRLRAEGANQTIDERKSRIQLLLDEDARLSGYGPSTGASVLSPLPKSTDPVSGDTLGGNPFTPQQDTWDANWQSNPTGGYGAQSSAPFQPQSQSPSQSVQIDAEAGPPPKRSRWFSRSRSTDTTDDAAASGAAGSLSDRIGAMDGSTRTDDVLGSSAVGREGRANWQSLKSRASALGAGLKRMRRPEGGDA